MLDDGVIDTTDVHFAVARAHAQARDEFQRGGDGGDMGELRHGLFLLGFVETHKGFHEQFGVFEAIGIADLTDEV